MEPFSWSYLEWEINLNKDKVAPVITLLGTNPVTITKGDKYRDAGATALDDIDGDISNKIKVNNTVNINIAGEYQTTYFVVDNADNKATEIRTVIVIV